MNKKDINLNVAVLTSSLVISKKSPIVYVTFHDDGVWEFWSDEVVDQSKIMVVSLKQILDIDPSVSQILDLSVGFAAIRGSMNENWKIISKN